MTERRLLNNKASRMSSSANDHKIISLTIPAKLVPTKLHLPPVVKPPPKERNRTLQAVTERYGKHSVDLKAILHQVDSKAQRLECTRLLDRTKPFFPVHGSPMQRSLMHSNRSSSM